MKVVYTNESGGDLSKGVLFSKEQCAEIREILDKVEPARWCHRPRINSIPTKGTDASDYHFLGHHQMSKEMSEYFFSLAPVIEKAKLAEVCINRYDPGGFMSEHRDSAAFYCHNMVIQLSEEGDGIDIMGEFIEDQAGHYTVFPAMSVPHSVPPVKHTRYVMICLYERALR